VRIFTGRMRLLLLLLLSIMRLIAASGGEEAALREIFEAVQAPRQWYSNANACRWFGVTCAGGNVRWVRVALSFVVVAPFSLLALGATDAARSELYLSGRDLTGTLPTAPFLALPSLSYVLTVSPCGANAFSRLPDLSGAVELRCVGGAHYRVV
jgi:hypothetical protein